MSFYVIYQFEEECFIQTLRSDLKKRGAAEFFEPTLKFLDIC